MEPETIKSQRKYQSDDPRLLGRETRGFQEQEDGMPGVESQHILNLYRTQQSLCYC
jgi:hypothetical protein